MKKTLRNIFLLGFSSLALFSCQSGGGDAGNSAFGPISPITERGEHLQTKTLHDVNVEESNRVFCKSGASDYRIVYEKDNTLAQKAAAFMATHINNATGVLLPTEEATDALDIKEGDKVILLGETTYQRDHNIPVSSKNIGPTGYQIVTKNDSYFIRVGGDLGFQQAAITFLKHAIGYTRYSADIVKYAKSGETIPSMDIVERPDFDFRTQSNKVDANLAYETGFLTLGQTFYNDADIQLFHNSFDYLPSEKYFEQHQKWYSVKGNQICYTAHGDEEEWDAMVEEVYDNMVTRLAKDKTVGAFTFSIQDNSDACTCDACKASIEKYGAESGAVVKFCNALDDKIQAHLKEEAEATGEPKREVNILFFAYNKTEKPCVTKNADGSFTPNSEDVVCNEHVGPLIALINSSYTTSLYDEKNSTYADALKGWGALSNKLYVWLYETNFSHYLYPLNTYSTMIESYRFCVENNGMYMFNEGQHNNGAVTCFGRFKEYFNEVSLFDVNSSYTAIVDDFFANYFDAAGSLMKTYFQELQDHCAYLEATYSTDLNGGIYNNIAQVRFWPKKLLDRWVSIINDAYKAIEPLMSSNRSLYEAVKKNITLESIFPRYALLNHYSGKYSSETLKAMRLSFRSDCQTVGLTNLNENAQIDSVFSAWGI